MRILDQIQQDNADARVSINKSVARMCNGEGISFKQVLFILFFHAVFISDKSSFTLYVNQLLDWRIHYKSTDNSLDYAIFCSFLNIFVKWYALVVEQ